MDVTVPPRGLRELSFFNMVVVEAPSNREPGAQSIVTTTQKRSPPIMSLKHSSKVSGTFYTRLTKKLHLKTSNENKTKQKTKQINSVMPGWAKYLQTPVRWTVQIHTHTYIYIHDSSTYNITILDDTVSVSAPRAVDRNTRCYAQYQNTTHNNMLRSQITNQTTLDR